MGKVIFLLGLSCKDENSNNETTSLHVHIKDKNHPFFSKYDTLGFKKNGIFCGVRMQEMPNKCNFHRFITTLILINKFLFNYFFFLRK